MGLPPAKPEACLPKDRVETAKIGATGDGGGIGGREGVEKFGG